ncbi:MULTISPECIES: RlpA-like double-psi beta-barrel domain-containing protein [Fredinandcohnia]|uniref:RlpA-like double-psi beta-barrel domain-containing protein n=1 Tax=Fredinandcohnia salidurans TaxID=2595041 RepID=A0ABW4MLD3_9BACI|nr:RlpA-like double-psi beta-barrel domain-containing protein [Fredinandcohnia onubensis]
MIRHTSGYYCPYCHGYLEPRNMYDEYYFQQYVPQYPAPYYGWDWNRNPETILGKATWTWGGTPTKCEIGWSYDNNMTVAVGENSPFKCGQRLRIRNVSFVPNQDIIVTVVDEVKKFPANRINLHRKAFEALGAAPSVGVLNVEITPID